MIHWPKYRCFSNEEECVNEMCKHPGFGWVINVANNKLTTVSLAESDFTMFSKDKPYKFLFMHYTFIDGMPFGKAIVE